MMHMKYQTEKTALVYLTIRRSLGPPRNHPGKSHLDTLRFRVDTLNERRQLFLNLSIWLHSLTFLFIKTSRLLFQEGYFWGSRKDVPCSQAAP